ncbi:MAG: hypothetical protein B7Z08_04335 [Sphingomonadales bacterium 32-68-7]|nr:MAG: hypothetical protein B7Z33_04760 [Sphingomonadales bacterium 12-68-11]OYX09648.1 MAG: hypothetical protein B7Z08_04335 [Sphingomonadales bacterium 32-68-7]
MVPSEADGETVDRLREENRVLRRENRNLRRDREVREAPKPLRRIFLEAVAGGSLITAAIGGGYTVMTDLVDDTATVCPPAHAALRDERLNPDLSPVQRKAYLDRQFRIAMSCGTYDR